MAAEYPQPTESPLQAVFEAGALDYMNDGVVEAARAEMVLLQNYGEEYRRITGENQKLRAERDEALESSEAFENAAIYWQKSTKREERNHALTSEAHDRKAQDVDQMSDRVVAAEAALAKETTIKERVVEHNKILARESLDAKEKLHETERSRVSWMDGYRNLTAEIIKRDEELSTYRGGPVGAGTLRKFQEERDELAGKYDRLRRNTQAAIDLTKAEKDLVINRLNDEAIKQEEILKLADTLATACGAPAGSSTGAYYREDARINYLRLRNKA